MDPEIIDEAEWPLVTVRWEGNIDDATLAIVLARMDIWLARGQRFGLLIDSRGAGGLSPEQRTRLIAHMKSRASRTSELLVQAGVMDNLIHRTLFHWINLLFPNPFPSKVFADPEVARAWLKSMLATTPDR